MSKMAKNGAVPVDMEQSASGAERIKALGGMLNQIL